MCSEIRGENPVLSGSGIPEDEKTLITPHAGDLDVAIRMIMEDTMASMVQMMQSMTEALQRVAAQQKIQSDRMEALEKQIRLNTPVTRAQSRMLTAAARTRAKELLARKDDGETHPQDDLKLVNRIAGIIRKSVLTRYGVSGMGEIPKYEYQVALGMITEWNEILVIRDEIREWRGRMKA